MDTFVPSVDGRFISERCARVAEVIADYDPTFELVWIPPEERDGFQKPFAVRHSPENKPSYIAFFLAEDEVDHRVLVRLWENDTTKNDVLARLELEDKAKEVMRYKEAMDRADERKDLVKHIVGSPLHRYRHNGVVYE